MALVFYYKDMLEKIMMQGTQQSSAFLCYRNPVKCCACAIAQTIETDCFCRNLLISNDPVVRVSRNLGKNSSETTWMIYHKKSEFLHKKFLIVQNMQWKRYTANYKSRRLCQNFIRTVLAEGIKGLFTWRWGTPGRWGPPPLWAYQSLHTISLFFLTAFTWEVGYIT